jgi:uncharacterized protein (DUF1800 family)
LRLRAPTVSLVVRLAACLGIAALAGFGCDTISPAAFTEHVLNRTGYGPDAWSRERIRTLGINAYLEEQLHPERIDDSSIEARVRDRFPALAMSLAQLQVAYRKPNGESWEVREQLTHAKLLRAIFSRRQLEQVLVDFWFDHFNVDARRRVALWAVAPYERDAIRPHVLGSFEDLLRAVARHPAMLEYLDNASNFRDGFVLGKVTYGVNENFARELLELHTVGADSGRRLSDIHDTALAFTGWTTADPPVGDAQGFAFLADGHDRSEKKILGLTLPAGRGIEDGDALIRHLARHPDTAANVARKLCQRFVAERPTACETAAAARFLATDGDLREVMRAILFSSAFREARHFRTKAKRPLHHLASLARAVGVANEAYFGALAVNEMRKWGEDPYGALPPTGWPDVSQAWLGQGAFIRRLDVFKLALEAGYGLRPPGSLGTQEPQGVFDGVVDRLLPGGTSAATRSAVLDYLATLAPSERIPEATAVLLVSPEFSHH